MCAKIYNNMVCGKRGYDFLENIGLIVWRLYKYSIYLQ